MHYYQFNIGDYQSHTKHLTPIEDLCYRRLLDHYYLHEKPIENNVAKIARLILLADYQKEVEQVLSEFFELTDAGWINHRADAEIKQYQGFREAGAKGAAKRWGKGGDSPPNSPPTLPLIANNKQETINKKQSKAHADLELLKDIPPQLVKDWLAIRKEKNLPLTKTALDAIASEAKKAGLTLEQAIKMCCENSWAGFKASWQEVKDATKQGEDNWYKKLVSEGKVL